MSGFHARATTAAATAILCLSTAAAATSTTGGAETWCFGASAIPDGDAATLGVIVPPAAEPRTITAVRVRVVASHPWTGDLALVLRHPSGAQVRLLDRPGVPSIGYPGPWGCGGSNVDALFDDLATLEAESACPYGATPAIAGPLRPNDALASLLGLAPQGAWSLVVADLVDGDAGTLASACLELETAPDCNANGVPDATDIATGASADLDDDGVPDECGCRADLDGDGFVGGGDLATMLSGWGACGGCSADLTGDGLVAGDDLALLLSTWGPCGGTGG
jgi:subtilisin-like proprotein convertase family protein